MNTGVILETREHGHRDRQAPIVNEVIIIFYLQGACNSARVTNWTRVVCTGLKVR